MPTIEEQIQDILDNRKTHVLQLEELQRKCAPVENIMTISIECLQELANSSPNRPLLVEACRGYISEINAFQMQFDSLQTDLRIARQRFLRDTINIGFGGIKGTGKSFLLQKLSGLSEKVVPSAVGLPVTAVRSVIMNSTENKAHINFFTVQGFLSERISPFCRKLGLPEPMTLEDFRSLKLPEKCNLDEDDIYRQKLADYQAHLTAYENLLGTGEKLFDLNEVRKYVSYRLPSENNPRGEDIYNWLAVESVRINCPFPRSDVSRLQLIDLPGLGELDPSLEKRHTENFKELLDLCLYIRRPSSDRVDWDTEAQNALKTLTDSCPVGKPSDFILLIINSGGCNTNIAGIMEDEIRQKLGARYTILKADGSDSDSLSEQVLSKALNFLAEVLPQNDQALAKKLFERYELLKKKVKAFVDDAKRLLRREGQDDTIDEMIFDKAKSAQEAFSDKSDEVLQDLERRALDGEEDPQELLDALDEIEKSIAAYLENGMDEGTYEKWIRTAIRKRAKDRSFAKFKVDTFNHMRVHIAKEFSASLNDVYRKYVEQYQGKAVRIFNDEEVFNGMLTGETPVKALKMLTEYMDQCHDSVENMRCAVEELIVLKVEHDMQFYPRVYNPIRELKNAVDSEIKLDGNSPDEQAESLYIILRDLGIKTVSDIKGMLIQEVRRDLFNILYVAFERFEDALIRSLESEKEWRRFFKNYPNIGKSGGKARVALLMNKTLKQLDGLSGSLY